MNKEYICLIDSGIGGLTTLKSIIKELPNENFLYFADDKNCPYGNKTKEEIKMLTLLNLNKLFKQYKIKMLVFACNTITASCVEQIRGLYNIPVIGIEPAIKLAMKNSKNKEILALTTKATMVQEKYIKLKENVCGVVHTLGLSNLAKDIENYYVKNEKIDFCKYIFLINKALEKHKNIDSVVLGCTHYSYLKEFFKNNIDCSIYDGNQGVAGYVKEIINNNFQKISKNNRGEVKIILSSNDKNKKIIYKNILNSIQLS